MGAAVCLGHDGHAIGIQASPHVPFRRLAIPPTLLLIQVDINSGPAFAFGEITLPPGGKVRVEAGAMAMTRGDVQMTTSTQGGFMKGLKRSLGGESFFVNDFSSTQGGVVGVAAALPGDMAEVHPRGACVHLPSPGLHSQPFRRNNR
jgi:hypothetical protein